MVRMTLNNTPDEGHEGLQPTSASTRLARAGPKQGFSLTELMIVVLVLGIVSMAVFPLAGTAVEDLRLSSATMSVVTALEYAQTRALQSGTQSKVRLNRKDEKVVIRYLAPTTNLLGGAALLPAETVERWTYTLAPHPTERGKDFVIPLDRTDIVSADFGGTNVVTFSALGMPSAPGTIVLRCGGAQREITVASLSGTITVGK